MPCRDERYSITDWQIEKKSDGTGFISPVGNSNVLDVAEEWRVEFKIKHGLDNQMFSIVYVSPDKYILVNRGKCLSFEDQYYRMRVCDYSNNQLYTIVDNSEAKELAKNKAIAGNLTPAFDQLQKSIEDNKELSKHIASSHKHGHKKHRHHHHHIKDRSVPFFGRQEAQPNRLSFMNN